MWFAKFSQPSCAGGYINKTKTGVQYLGKGKKEFQILVDGQQIQQSNNFIYLGGTSVLKVEQMKISQEG